MDSFKEEVATGVWGFGNLPKVRVVLLVHLVTEVGKQYNLYWRMLVPLNPASGCNFEPERDQTVLCALVTLHSKGKRWIGYSTGVAMKTIVTWLILPVVICLSQRLSHACLSINALYCETANGSLNQL
jgi:hypothetical protein